MRNYQLTETAQADLEEIFDYIAGRMRNPDGAQVVLEYLYNAMQAVADNPGCGHERRDLTNRPVKFYRQCKEHKYYNIFDPNSQPITIVRVASVPRDFVSLLDQA